MKHFMLGPLRYWWAHEFCTLTYIKYEKYGGYIWTSSPWSRTMPFLNQKNI